MFDTLDRRVRARLNDCGELVRYDRAGKWWVEYPSGQRKPLTFREAVLLACDPTAYVLLGVPGGGRFDRAVGRILTDSS